MFGSPIFVGGLGRIHKSSQKIRALQSLPPGPDQRFVRLGAIAKPTLRAGVGTEGPHRRVGVHSPNSRRHNKAWQSITQGATTKHGSPDPRLEGPQQHSPLGGFQRVGSTPPPLPSQIHFPISRMEGSLWVPKSAMTARPWEAFTLLEQLSMGTLSNA